MERRLGTMQSVEPVLENAKKIRKVKDWNQLLDKSVAPKTKVSYMKHYKDFMRHHGFKLGQVEAFNQEELQLYSDHLDNEYKKKE
jgi:hypothetical protein